MISANYFVSTANYTNDDAIANTINYICRLNNEHIFFYGSWPPTKEAAIQLFEDVRYIYHPKTASQKVQHFWISFDHCSNITIINSLAEQIAFLLAPTFPICFATHNDKDHIHVHFIVSTTSILPEQPPLIGKVWKNAVTSIRNYAKSNLDLDLNIFYKEPELANNTHHKKGR